MLDIDAQPTDDMCNTDLLTCDNASTASLCSLIVNDIEKSSASTTVQVRSVHLF